MPWDGTYRPSLALIIIMVMVDWALKPSDLSPCHGSGNKCVCRDKRFVATKDVTKMIFVPALANDACPPPPCSIENDTVLETNSFLHVYEHI